MFLQGAPVQILLQFNWKEKPKQVILKRHVWNILP